jgi:hypothetical protein
MLRTNTHRYIYIYITSLGLQSQNIPIQSPVGLFLGIQLPKLARNTRGVEICGVWADLALDVEEGEMDI